MKHLTAFLVLILLGASFATVLAQETQVSDQVAYTIELPSSLWRSISEPDTPHERAEFVYGDRLDGYLQIRKEIVDAARPLRTSPDAIRTRNSIHSGFC